MSKEVSEVLNERLQDEIGFKPTIRNIFAIILAGADTFLRLMDIVHTNAMEVKSNPQRLKISKDSKSSDTVFPWPQYYVVEEEDECTTSSVLKYPGAKDVIGSTGGLSTRFMRGATVGQEIDNTILELGTYDGTNLYKRVSESFGLNNVFKDVKNFGDVNTLLKTNDPDKYNLYLESDTITPQTNTKTYNYSYTELGYTVSPEEFTENIEGLKKLKDATGVYDLAPTIFGPWAKVNYANGLNTLIGLF